MAKYRVALDISLQFDTRNQATNFNNDLHNVIERYLIRCINVEHSTRRFEEIPDIEDPLLF